MQQECQIPIGSETGVTVTYIHQVVAKRLDHFTHAGCKCMTFWPKKPSLAFLEGPVSSIEHKDTNDGQASKTDQPLKEVVELRVFASLVMMPPNSKHTIGLVDPDTENEPRSSNPV
jgi:hypothetical protein